MLGEGRVTPSPKGESAGPPLQGPARPKQALGYPPAQDLARVSLRHELRPDRFHPELRRSGARLGGTLFDPQIGPCLDDSSLEQVENEWIRTLWRSS